MAKWVSGAMLLFFSLFIEAKVEQPLALVQPLKKSSQAFALNPIRLATKAFVGRYFYKLNPNAGLSVPFSILYSVYGGEVFGAKGGRIAYHQEMIGLGLRLHLDGEFLESGWFVEPSVLFGNAAIRPNNQVWEDGFSAMYSFLVGYTWAWPSGLLINLGSGLGYQYQNGSQELKNQYWWYSGLTYDGELSVAYAW